MSVTGYLSLYTTLLGWQQYQNLWALMVGTGLVFIPFIGIVMKSFLEPFESQEPKSAAVIALRRLMIGIVGALIIIEFACVPTVPLDPKVLHYEPICVAGKPNVATPGNTGTTYDHKLPVATGVKVPILWYLVMAVSNGFTHAATKGLRCSPIDYQGIQNQLNVNHITSPTLKNETVEFYNDCYIPAYSHYMAGDMSESEKAQIRHYQSQYGKDDIGWLGSHAFLNVPSFYDRFYAREPIQDFAFDPTRDQFEGQTTDHSKWGQPDCKSWWTAPQNGLQKNLEQALPPNLLETLLHLGNHQAAVDAGIKSLIQRSFDAGFSISDRMRGYESLNSETCSHIYGYVAGTIGLKLHTLTYTPKLYLLINALPIIQALLLLSIYALLAIMIPFSSYRLHFIITGSCAIFAITFWNYLWHLVRNVNNDLIAALYPSIPDGLFTLKNNNTTLVHFIVGTMYIALPMLFLILASWAGLKISNSLMGAVNEMRAPSDASGKQGGDLAKSVATSAIKFAAAKK